ncbi:MAG: leucine-rich repeat domain-containing protein [Propionibacteriaceae bacterium]|nr:leucine-rich repeat domain-containing protein [Propionibacteriaceae bacterium]
MKRIGALGLITGLLLGLVTSVSQAATGTLQQYFPDPALARAVLQKMSLEKVDWKPTAVNLGTVTSQQLASIKGTLDLSGAGITSLAGINALTGLETLDIGDNNISSIAVNTFSGMYGLRNLYFTDSITGKCNPLTTLPIGVFNDLQQLTYLNMRHCSFSSLPSTLLASLTGLQEFHFSNTPLSTLPAGFLDYNTSLRALYLDFVEGWPGSRLTSLPSTLLAKLPQLQILNISHNLIESLPSNFFDGNPLLTEVQVDGQTVFDGLPAAGSKSRELAVQLSYPSANLMQVTGYPKYGAELGITPNAYPLDTRATAEYQWYVSSNATGANATAIVGADTSTYSPTLTDVGNYVFVSLTYRSAWEPAQLGIKLYSTPVKITGLAFAAAPVPAISGSVRVGQTVSVSPGAWDPAPTFSYRWLRNGKAITGATNATYTVKAADLGKKLSVRIAGNYPGYNGATRVSNAKLVAVGKITKGTVKLSGTASPGHTLKLKLSGFTSGVKYTVTWYRGSTKLKGSSLSHKVTTSDRGHSVYAKVTFTKTAYQSLTVKSNSKAIPKPKAVKKTTTTTKKTTTTTKKKSSSTSTSTQKTEPACKEARCS